MGDVASRAYAALGGQAMISVWKMHSSYLPWLTLHPILPAHSVRAHTGCLFNLHHYYMLASGVGRNPAMVHKLLADELSMVKRGK
eukprot:979132-Pelagomonas_calceolata.AAC.4